MRVCVLSGSSFEQNYSSYHLMRDLLQKLLDDGHEVGLIQKCFSKNGCLPLELEGKTGLTVKDIPVKQAEKNNLIKRMLADIRYYIKTAKAIRAYKHYDVFFLQSNNIPWLPIGIIKLMTRKPVVYNVQDIFPQNAIYSGILNGKSSISKVLLMLQKWSLRHSTYVITISEDMKETLVSAGADAECVYVAYNWKNDVNDANVKIKREEDGKFRVVYAGNIGRMQNVEVIIRTAAELKDHPNIQFEIYGNGALKEKCIELANELKTNNVHFLQPVPANQAYSLYEQADLNIIPLAKNIVKTALPSKTAVCLECGKPVVFAIGETSRFSQEAKAAQGVMVTESDDERKLAETIISLYESGAKRLEADFLNRQFSKDNIDKYEDVLRRACSQ